MDAAWIVEGASVAEYTGDVGYADVTFTTIAELSPLWIVLENGNRYYRTTCRPYGSDEQREVMAADDQRVQDALAVRILARALTRIHELERGEPALNEADALAALDEIEKAIREARAAITGTEK